MASQQQNSSWKSTVSKSPSLLSQAIASSPDALAPAEQADWCSCRPCQVPDAPLARALVHHHSEDITNYGGLEPNGWESFRRKRLERENDTIEKDLLQKARSETNEDLACEEERCPENALEAMKKQLRDAGFFINDDGDFEQLTGEAMEKERKEGNDRRNRKEDLEPDNWEE